MLILKGHQSPVQSVAFTADGSALLSVEASDTLRVWDMPGGTLRWKDDSAFYASVALTPDGRHVLACDRADTRVIDQSGRPRSAYSIAHPNQVRDIVTGEPAPAPLQQADGVVPHQVTFTPDGARCVAGTAYNWTDLVWWAYPSGESLPTWKNVVPSEYLRFRAMVFSPDGRVLAGMNGAGVTVLDAATGNRLFAHPFKTVQDECRLAFHPDSRRLALASGTRAAVLDLETRQEVAQFKQAKKYFLQLAFTPDGRHLATVGNEATVKYWDSATGQLVTEYAWDVGGLRCLAFSPDGLLGAAGGMGKKVVVWDVEG